LPYRQLIMSFGFGVGDFITIGRLLWKLREDYASAPSEGLQLADDLQVMEQCINSLEGSYGPDESGRLHSILQPLLTVLREIEGVTERYSNLNASKSRVWDRITFPRVRIQALHKQMRLRIQAMTLFLSGQSNRSLVRIEEALGGITRAPGQQIPNFSSFLVDLDRQGIERKTAVQYKEPIEKYLIALSEVEEAESQLEAHENTKTIEPEDAVDQDIIVGPPTADHLISLTCPGAGLLRQGKQASIKQNKSLLLRHFGASKFEISCRYCRFHGFQDDPIKTKEGLINTPLFFWSRREAPKQLSMEYHLDIHKTNRKHHDGIFYRTIFFWKCHMKASSPSLHTDSRYECVFCPLEIGTFGVKYDRQGLLEHIRRSHVQTPPSPDLREKYNVWIDDRPALFEKDQKRIVARSFDILIPRAHGRTEKLRAEHDLRRRQEQQAAEVERISRETAEAERAEIERIIRARQVKPVTRQMAQGDPAAPSSPNEQISSPEQKLSGEVPFGSLEVDGAIGVRTKSRQERDVRGAREAKERRSDGQDMSALPVANTREPQTSMHRLAPTSAVRIKGPQITTQRVIGIAPTIATGTPSNEYPQPHSQATIDALEEDEERKAIRLPREIQFEEYRRAGVPPQTSLAAHAGRSKTVDPETLASTTYKNDSQRRQVTNGHRIVPKSQSSGALLRSSSPPKHLFLGGSDTTDIGLANTPDDDLYVVEDRYNDKRKLENNGDYEEEQPNSRNGQATATMDSTAKHGNKKGKQRG
jgi:hypothetical protein